MQHERKIYRYFPTQRDYENQAIININKNMAKTGFILGCVVVGGYHLYRKINELSKDVRKIKEEMGK